jgi:hypothetical protein
LHQINLPPIPIYIKLKKVQVGVHLVIGVDTRGARVGVDATNKEKEKNKISRRTTKVRY